MLCRSYWQALFRRPSSILASWRDGRADDCTGLENQRASRPRGFESPSLRNDSRSTDAGNKVSSCLRGSARGRSLSGKKALRDHPSDEFTRIKWESIFRCNEIARVKWASGLVSNTRVSIRGDAGGATKAVC